MLAESLGLGQLQLELPERLVAMSELRNRTGFQQMPFRPLHIFREGVQPVVLAFLLRG